MIHSTLANKQIVQNRKKWWFESDHTDKHDAPRKEHTKNTSLKGIFAVERPMLIVY